MKIEEIKKKSFALSIIAFPVMLLVGFLMHPNLLKLEALHTVEQLVGRFHNQPILPYRTFNSNVCCPGNYDSAH